MLCCGVIGIFFDTTIRKDGFFLAEGNGCLFVWRTDREAGRWRKGTIFETAWEGDRQICFKIVKMNGAIVRRQESCLQT